MVMALTQPVRQKVTEECFVLLMPFVVVGIVALAASSPCGAVI
jgi:hypothetical protein